jgi:uncharacterized protein YutE (UPF0331/DUF86 family)
MKNTDLNLQRTNEKISFVLSNLENLKTLRDIPENEFHSDFRNIESAKHLLQVSIEAMLDIIERLSSAYRIWLEQHYNNRNVGARRASPAYLRFVNEYKRG